MRGPLGLTRRWTRIAPAGFASLRDRVNSNVRPHASQIVHRSIYWLCVVGLPALAVYCVLSAVTIAWLGSFPDRAGQGYGIRTLAWLAGAALSLTIAVYVGFRFRSPRKA